MKTLKELCFLVMLENNLEPPSGIRLYYEYEYWKSQMTTCSVCREWVDKKLGCERCVAVHYCQECFYDLTYVCGQCYKSVCYCCQVRRHSCLDCLEIC
jgi:hypothetical protein